MSRLGNLALAPLGLGEDEDFRISIAGAQEKTALLFWKGRWYKPLATTATMHILKPQIGRLPNGIDLSYSIENEFFCLTLTADRGYRYIPGVFPYLAGIAAEPSFSLIRVRLHHAPRSPMAAPRRISRRSGDLRPRFARASVSAS